MGVGRVSHSGRGCRGLDVGREQVITVGTRRLMRQLRYGLWVAVLFGSQEARVRKRVPFGL